MTQAIPPSIYGQFIEIFSLEWITFQHDANLLKPFTLWICYWMTGWLKGDWEEHEKCLRVFSTCEFLHFFQIWWSLKKQKYGFLATRGKNYSFLHNQNMKSILYSWINFYMKVLFLGLWQIPFFQKFGKNIGHLYYR